MTHMTDLEWLRAEVSKHTVAVAARRLELPAPTVLSLLAGTARPSSHAKLKAKREALA